MKIATTWFTFAALLGCALISTNNLLGSTLFSDTFESGTVGANIGAPWGANNITPATYQSTGNPFSDGSIYADLNDPGPGTNPSQAIRMLSNAGNDATLSPSLNGQVSTYSFDFWEPIRTGDINSLIFGYYKQQSNPDLNTAGRNYSATMHDGTLSPQGTILAGAAVTYPQETVNTVFMMSNDTASSIANYAGTSHTLAAHSADIWISDGGAAPLFAFSVSEQNSGSTISGVGFRTNNADIERFFVNDVLVTSDATFDRTAIVPEPSSLIMAVFGGLGLAAVSVHRRRMAV